MNVVLDKYVSIFRLKVKNSYQMDVLVCYYVLLYVLVLISYMTDKK